MSYIIQRDDNGKDMLVEYDSGCGCCAGYRAINVTEADTFYDTKYLDHGKVAEAIREQIAVHQDSIRELQEFALGRFELLRWGLSPDMTPVEAQRMANETGNYDPVPEHTFIETLKPYDGDLG